MKATIISVYLTLSTAAMSEPDDLVLDIKSWDQEKAKTISGWFTDSEKLKSIEPAAADSAPTRKAIEAARSYLSSTFPELGEDDPFESTKDDSTAMGKDPFRGPAKKYRVKSWDFIEMSIHPIDLGHGRGTLISWKPSVSGLFYYALKFRPQLEDHSTYQTKTVVLLPNLELVPYRTIPATESEREQIICWERHLGHDTPLNKKEALPQPDTK